MLCIKSVKGLTSQELNELQQMVDNDVFLQANIILLEKSNTNDEIFGFLAIKQSNDINVIHQIFVKPQNQNKGIGQKMLYMAKTIVKSSLYVCIHQDNEILTYFLKHNFQHYSQQGNYVILITYK